MFVLISKGKEVADMSSSYRPLCILDTDGRLLERMLELNIEGVIMKAGANIMVSDLVS